MTKNEYYTLCSIDETISMIVDYHNKNLTKSQYYDLEDSRNKIKKLIKHYSNKRLKRMMKDLGKKTYEEIIKKEFGI